MHKRMLTVYDLWPCSCVNEMARSGAGGESVPSAVKCTITGADAFYAAALGQLQECVPFMIGGAYALRVYGDIYRDTKDLDIFCKAGDYPRLLETLADHGYSTEVTDANWLAKARHEDHMIDVIFNSRNGLCPVDDTWLAHARPARILDLEIRLIPPEEEIWTKLYVQDRHRFDGSDVNHIIRKMGQQLDWERLLRRMEVHWELLLQQCVHFRYVYPSEGDNIPSWLMTELLGRMKWQESMPRSRDAVCRGATISQDQYVIDLTEWGYKPT